MPCQQGIYWIGTLPSGEFDPHLPDGVKWIRGQLESGSNTGYLHWQVLVAFSEKKTLRQCRDAIGSPTGHWELSRSDAASKYVWKEDTRVEGTQFELGHKPFKRNDSHDWDEYWRQAVDGDVMEIPSDIRIRHYTTFRRIREDFKKPLAMERTCYVFWGDTGTGKSRAAWEAGGLDAYPKDPNTKFWCGYNGNMN